jgi:hypothetical protein|uniref:Uncharacterized protein n=1 Tax=viral metagenome TaxID=1070528 RepID=A0A6C0IP88_9ZZZZ
MSNYMFENSVTIIMSALFVIIILYMLFSTSVQKIYLKPHLVQPDGFAQSSNDGRYF